MTIMEVHLGMRPLLVFCPCFISLCAICFPQSMIALPVIVTITGTVDSGTDGNPNFSGPTKVFGGGANLAGEPFTLTLNFDTALGTSSYSTCPDRSIYESANVGHDAQTGPTAVLMIGNGNFSFGTLPLNYISWTIDRSAPATCTSPYSSIGFSWSESYRGNYAGGAGLGGINFYPPTQLPSGDWRTSLPPTAISGTFQFNIDVGQNGTQTGYAIGYLNATEVLVAEVGCPSSATVDNLSGPSSDYSGVSLDRPPTRHRPVRTCAAPQISNNILVSISLHVDLSDWTPIYLFLQGGQEYTFKAGPKIALVSSSDAPFPTLSFYFTVLALPLNADGTLETPPTSAVTSTWLNPVEYPSGPTGTIPLTQDQLVVEATFSSSSGMQQWTIKIPPQEDTNGNYSYYGLAIYAPKVP